MADSEVRAAIVTELVSFPDFQWNLVENSAKDWQNSSVVVPCGRK